MSLVSPVELKLNYKIGQAVVDVTDMAIASLPKFVQGDGIPFRLWFIEQSGADASYLPVAGVAPFMALGNLLTEPPTYYTQQATWAANADLANPYFEAVLPMNTSDINSILLPSGNPVRSVKADFAVNFTTSDGVKNALLATVIIYRSLISPVSTLVPPGETPLSLEAARLLFLSRTIVGSVTWVSADDPSKKRITYAGADGAFHEDVG